MLLHPSCSSPPLYHILASSLLFESNRVVYLSTVASENASSKTNKQISKSYEDLVALPYGSTAHTYLCAWLFAKPIDFYCITHWTPCLHWTIQCFSAIKQRLKRLGTAGERWWTEASSNKYNINENAFFSFRWHKSCQRLKIYIKFPNLAVIYTLLYVHLSSYNLCLCVFGAIFLAKRLLNHFSYEKANIWCTLGNSKSTMTNVCALKSTTKVILKTVNTQKMTPFVSEENSRKFFTFS